MRRACSSGYADVKALHSVGASEQTFPSVSTAAGHVRKNQLVKKTLDARWSLVVVAPELSELSDLCNARSFDVFALESGDRFHL